MGATERFSQNLISSNSYVWFHNLVGSFCIEDCIRNNWILGSLPLCHHASFVKFMLYPEMLGYLKRLLNHNVELCWPGHQCDCLQKTMMMMTMMINMLVFLSLRNKIPILKKK